MNYLDELLTIYDGQPDPLVRKYLLCAMGLRPLTFASQDLLELLWGEVAASDARVRHAARRELGRVLPRHLKRDYGLEPGNASVWTGYYTPRTKGEPDRWQPAWDAAAQPAVDAGLQMLWPAARKALELTRTGAHAVSQVASLAVGRIPLAPVSAALAARVNTGEAAFHEAAALAELGTPEAHEVLLAAARKWGLSSPDLVTLLSTIPPEQTLPVLEAMESRTDAYGRTNAAIALGQDRSERGRELLTRLAKRREAFATAHVLDVLQSEPRVEDLPLIQMVFALEVHDFLRTLAVRTAGYALAPPTVAFVRARTGDPSPRVRASALEALARLRVAPETLAEAASALVDAPLLKARVTALLALAPLDAERVAAASEALLFSGEPIQRLEGAYLLGYLTGAESAAALTEMALQDPDEDVRCQAVKSLARQPERIGLERLVALLAAPDAHVARMAARALPLLAPAALPAALAGLAQAARTATEPRLKAVLLRSTGMAAARLPGTQAPAVLRDHLSSSTALEVWGALEGLKLMLGAGGAEVGALTRHDDPRVRASAAVAAFWSGDEAAGAALEAQMGEAQEEAVLAALNALAECAALLPRVAASGRCPALAARARGESAQTLAEVRLDPLSQHAGATLDEEWVPADAPATLTKTAERLRTNYRSAATPAVPRDASVMGQLSPLARRPRAMTGGEGHVERSVIGQRAPGRRTVRAAMGELTPLAPPPARRRAVAIAAVVGVAVLLVGGLAWRARAPATMRAAAVHAFLVESVRGSAFRAGVERPVPLAVGAHVSTGDQLGTGSESRMEARSPEAVSLMLEAGSALTLGPSPDAPRADVWFSDPRGSVTLDLRRAGESWVWVPPCLVHGTEALIRVEQTGGARTLAVQGGRVEVTGAGEPRMLGDGMREPLPPHP